MYRTNNKSNARIYVHMYKYMDDTNMVSMSWLTAPISRKYLNGLLCNFRANPYMKPPIRPFQRLQ